MTCNLDNNLDMKKKSSTLQFKLKNYNRWKLLVNNCSKDDFKNKSIINKTISSKSLLKKIEEINDNNTLIEIDETKNLIETLESKISNDFTTKKINKNKGFIKNKNKTSTYKNVDLYNLQRVNGIGQKTAQKYLDKNIKLENITIKNLIIKPREVIGLKDEKTNKPIVDFSGSLLMFTDCSIPWITRFNTLKEGGRRERRVARLGPHARA